MKLLERCLCCGEAMPDPFLDLGAQPLANNYHDGMHPLPTYPLAVAQCNSCRHRQLTVAVEPAEMFDTYLYVSGTSRTLHNYFRDFVTRIVAEAGANIHVLDIGCNDGSLLQAFAPYVTAVCGVDPAQNLTELARASGIDVITGYWSETMARSWTKRFEVIVAMNVVAHVADPLGFLTACKHVLAPGCRIYVQTSQCNWLENGEFDCVYHEHLSYFTEESFCEISKRAGLHLAKVEKVPIHGESWLFTLTDPLGRFAAEVEAVRDWMRARTERARTDGYAVVGYGAAAKGNTVLNYAGIALDYIVDDNPLKWGLLTPGTNIPIVGSDRLCEEDRPVALFLLAWNFEKEIVEQVRRMRTGKYTRFVRYFPTREEFE